MPDEPETIGEVARLIKALEQHIDRRFNAIEQRQDRHVTIDLYNANLAHIDQQIAELRRLLAEERQNRVESDAAEAREREKAAEGNKERIKSLGATARWSITVSVSILAVFLTILFRGVSGG